MSGYNAEQQALIEGFINMHDMQALRGEEAVDLGEPLQSGDDSIQLKVAEEGEEESTSHTRGAAPHRKEAGALKENVSIYKSAFHIFKVNVGTGVFLIPTFFHDSGYVLSTVFMVLVGLAVMDCSLQLLSAKRLINRPNVATYSQLTAFIFGLPGRIVLLIALITTQFGFDLMYTQLFAGVLNDLVPRFRGDTYVWITMLFAVVTPATFFSDNLSILAIASIIATVCVFFCLIGTFVKACITLRAQGVDPTTTVVGQDIPLGWFNNLANDMMVLEGIGMVLPVENSCVRSDKKKVPMMIMLVLVGVVAWYSLYGLIGYLAYGTHMSSSLVDAMPLGDPFSTVIRVAFLINILCTYPIQFMPAIQQIDTLLNCRPRSLIGLSVRLLINAVIAGIAMGIGPGAVNTVVAFIGALPATVMIMILPPLITLQVHQALRYPDAKRMSREYLKRIFVPGAEYPICSIARARCYLYFTIGILIMVIGTFSIVKGLLNK